MHSAKDGAVSAEAAKCGRSGTSCFCWEVESSEPSPSWSSRNVVSAGLYMGWKATAPKDHNVLCTFQRQHEAAGFSARRSDSKHSSRCVAAKFACLGAGW